VAEAARLRPDLIEAQRALAEVALRRGIWRSWNRAQIKSLIDSLPRRKGICSTPWHSSIAVNFKAEADIRKAMSVAPQNAAPLVQMGNLT